MKTWVYIAGGVLALVVFIVLFLQFGGVFKGWGDSEARKEVQKLQDLLKKDSETLTKQKELNDQTQKEYEATQNAVRNLSQEIMRLRKDADKSKQEALVAIQKQQEKNTIALELALKVQQLELELKNKKSINTLQEAQNELVKYGIK